MLQDALTTLPHVRYGPEYLAAVVYPRMAREVGAGARVVEVGVRPEDRGVISRGIIPHLAFLPIDRNAARARACGGVCLDVLQNAVRADVILSTCALHHTLESEVPRLLANLRAPLLMFSGPSADVCSELYGDHLWHLEERKLRAWLLALGYCQVSCEPIGLTEPFSELLVVARKA